MTRAQASRLAGAVLAALLIAAPSRANAGVRWGDLGDGLTPTRAQEGPRPTVPVTSRIKPRYISGYAGTVYPPLGSRYRVRRPNYGTSTGLRGFLNRLKQSR